MLKHLIPLLFAPVRFAPDGDGGNGDGTGAMPGTGATPAQAAQTGAAAGAMPATAAGKDPATAAKPATGDAALGDTGKAALDAERDARKAAEADAKELRRQLEQVQAGTQTEHEQAVSKAVREATASERGKWQSHIRAAEVRGALRGAGVTNANLLGLLTNAAEVRDLKVDNDTGEVEGVTEAIEKLKAGYPEAFGQPAEPGPGGSWGGSEGGSKGKKPETLEEAIQAGLAKQGSNR